MVSAAQKKKQLKETKLEGLLKVNLASKMAAKLSFQSNLEFTGPMSDQKLFWSDFCEI